MLSNKVVLSHKVVPSQTVSMVSHKVVLSRKVVLSCQALCRSAQVVSQRTFWVVAASRNLGTSNGREEVVKILCVDKINRSTKAHNFRRDVVNSSIQAAQLNQEK